MERPDPPKPAHIPVLGADGGTPVESTILGVLRPQRGESVLDVTLGLGGHTLSFLEATGTEGKVTGVDADTENMDLAKQRIGDRKNFFAVHCNFRDVSRLGQTFDVVFADLGVSSPHLDDPTRGFTFRASAPLDLRYDRTSGQMASELLASMEEHQITTMLRMYGELSEAKRLARSIAKAVEEGKMQTTDDLRAVVESTVGYRAPKLLPQVFQALRIAVNDEIGALQSLLEALPIILRPGGRAGFISYHSLEDRLVKQTFRAMTTPEKDEQTGAISKEADYSLLTRKAIVPSDDEIARNPRSRSAKFRAIRRLR